VTEVLVQHHWEKYLVSTTGDLPSRSIDSIRIYAPARRKKSPFKGATLAPATLTPASTRQNHCAAVLVPCTVIMTLEFGVPTVGLAGIGVAHFGSCLVGCEHPFDACACGISLSFPGEDFGFEALARPDPAVEALDGPGRAFFVQWTSICVLHFACKLLRFHCDELRCFVLKMLISKR
jgi:hypothetical protein